MTSIDERFFVERNRKNEYEIYEKDGAFYDHNDQDLFIAAFSYESDAARICKLLSIGYYTKHNCLK
jgi:hypothetical protein